MNEVKRFCADCKTTRTPLWRSGPLGPRSLCNACGIRYRKRKMANDHNINSENTYSSIPSDDHQMRETINLGYAYNQVGNDMILQGPLSSSCSSSQPKKQRCSSNSSASSSKSARKLGEVEQAAVLLMSLSCGSVFA